MSSNNPSRHAIITVSSKRYEDCDDCLAAAAADYIASHPDLRGWDLSPRWGGEGRETIQLTVPTWALASKEVVS